MGQTKPAVLLYLNHSSAVSQGKRIADLIEIKYIGIIKDGIIIIQQGATLFGRDQ